MEITIFMSKDDKRWPSHVPKTVDIYNIESIPVDISLLEGNKRESFWKSLEDPNFWIHNDIDQDTFLRWLNVGKEQGLKASEGIFSNALFYRFSKEVLSFIFENRQEGFELCSCYLDFVYPDLEENPWYEFVTKYEWKGQMKDRKYPLSNKFNKEIYNFIYERIPDMLTQHSCNSKY